MAKLSKRVPSALKAKYQQIEKLIVGYSNDNLDENYREYCLFLTAALARKKDSPLVKGKANLWACGVIHAIGMVNFLFDKHTKPYVRASQMYSHFGVSSSSGSAKSKFIRDAFDIYPSDPNWTLPNRLLENPLVWLASVNGQVVDIRDMPLEIQEQALEQGIIPFIPKLQF